jgi:release factor glutamine methyltransferase
VKSDLFSAFLPKDRPAGSVAGGASKKDFWNMIVSNPPYVPEDEIKKLPREVRSEPASALDGGEKGLEVIAKILEQAPFFLKKNGWLLMEIGAGQSKVLKKKISKDTHFKDLYFVKDLNGIDRVLAVRKA